jgi:hypothetical protein
VWIVRPLKAAIVLSTKPVCVTRAGRARGQRECSMTQSAVEGAALRTRLVQRVGVDVNLHVVLVGDREADVDVGRRRPPVLVQLETASARADAVDEATWARIIALAGEAVVEREAVGRSPARKTCRQTDKRCRSAGRSGERTSSLACSFARVCTSLRLTRRTDRCHRR